MSDTPDDLPERDFPPYDERSSVEVEANEVPADSFDDEAADFDTEPDADDCGEAE